MTLYVKCVAIQNNHDGEVQFGGLYTNYYADQTTIN